MYYCVRIIPFNEQSLLVVCYTQKKSLENSLRCGWQFDRSAFFKIAIDSDKLVVKNCKIGVIVPN